MSKHAKTTLNKTHILYGALAGVALGLTVTMTGCMQYSSAIAAHQAYLIDQEIPLAATNDATYSVEYMHQDFPQDLQELAARKVAEREEQARLEEEARIAAELEAQRQAEEAARVAAAQSYSYSSGGSISQSPSGYYEGVLTKSGGVAYGPSGKETWYSQAAPGWEGGGLNIPGRHVDENGLVRDGDGYIVIATPQGNMGAIYETTLGTGKVYDTNAGGDSVDIYTNW